MKKRILSLILALLMMCSLLPVGALAASEVASGEYDENGSHITWSLDSDGLLSVSGNGSLSSQWENYKDSILRVEIGEGITEIGSCAFMDCKNLNCVNFPDSLNTIGFSAFYRCTSLENIQLPEHITSIGNIAFSYTGYDNNDKNWDNSTLYIGDYLIKSYAQGTYTIKPGTRCIAAFAFSHSNFDGTYQEDDSLTSVIIPEGIENIGACAFAGCAGLESITLPNTVNSLDDGAFTDCVGLESITLPDTINSLGRGAFQNTAYYNNLENWSDSLLYIGNYLINAKAGITVCIVKPGTIGIASGAFYRNGYFNSSLESVTLPESLKYIGDYAFSSCDNLKSVTLSENLLTIGDYAFYNCLSLPSISIPATVVSIGDSAFSGCSKLEMVNVDKQNRYYCSVDGVLLTHDRAELILCPRGKGGVYKVPDGVKCIKSYSFTFCPLESITFPDSLESIEDNAFAQCAFNSITLPANVSKVTAKSLPFVSDIFVDNGNPYYCSIDGVLFTKDHTTLVYYPTLREDGRYIVPCGTTKIADSAFWWAGCLDVVLPNGLTEIGTDALWGLNSVTIPTSVSEIHRSSFSNCTFSDIYYGGTEEQWNEINFDFSLSDAYSWKDATIHFNSDIPRSHVYDQNVTAPTCTEKGYTTHTCSCGDSYIDSYIDALGHKTEVVGLKAATCTEAGYTGDTVCIVCKEVVKKGETIPALGHDYKDGVCTVCGAKDPNYKPAEYPFTDVDTTGRHAPFADAIQWAANEGITTGYGDGIFKPNLDCSRAQVVTFLWRAAGEPEPKSTANPFVDVAAKQANGKDNPFYTAILWAVGEGITNGVDSTHFAPDATVTRAQFVTFLWRYENKPAAKPGVTLTDINTVTNADFRAAILWAAGEGITTGYPDGSFRPNAGCTRAHVVTFIYRDMT